MDWSAKLFGLADHFLNSSEVGGGVLQVKEHELIPNTSTISRGVIIDDCIRFRTSRNRRGSH